MKSIKYNERNLLDNKINKLMMTVVCVNVNYTKLLLLKENKPAIEIPCVVSTPKSHYCWDQREKNCLQPRDESKWTHVEWVLKHRL